MIVVDVETGGLDPSQNPLLSIGAVEFKNPKNTFYCEIRPFEGLEISKQALRVNGIDLEEWNNKPNLAYGMADFKEWISDIDEITLAGHNPSFDRDFCNANFERVGEKKIFNHRTVDLHSVAWAYFTKKKTPFNKLYSDEIYRLLGMRQEPRPHNALNGAMWEESAFRKMLK